MVTKQQLNKRYRIAEESPIFDTIKLATGTTYNSISFFSSPQNGDVKTEVDTNLMRPGMLEANEQFSIEAIRVVLNPDISEADAKVILKNTLLKFIKSNDNVVYKTPLSRLSLVSSGAVKLGVAENNNLIVFSSPIQLEPNVSFKAEIISKPGFQVAADSYIKMFLEGFYFKSALRG